MKIAIIITAYNRSSALKQLLASLQEIDDCGVSLELVISLEYGATADVIKIAESFIWKHGSVRVVKHDSKLGLRNHFLWVGDQTEKYGRVIFLEDDLFVSPCLISAVQQFSEHYENDDSVAGVSLYSPLICEFNATRFYPIDDGYDNYFLQHPYWGNVWEKKKWQKFKEWLITYERNEVILPDYVKSWKSTSFKVVFIQYLIGTNRYIAYPRVSLVNNMGFSGLHNSGMIDKKTSTTFLVPLQLKDREYRLSNFSSSLAIYDAYFEISSDVLKRLNAELKGYDFDVDLKHTRSFFTKQYRLTIGDDSTATLSFCDGMKPLESSVVLALKGKGIMLIDNSLYKKPVSNKKVWFEDYKSNNMTGRRYLLRSLFMTFKELFSRIK